MATIICGRGIIWRRSARAAACHTLLHGLETTIDRTYPLGHNFSRTDVLDCYHRNEQRGPADRAKWHYTAVYVARTARRPARAGSRMVTSCEASTRPRRAQATVTTSARRRSTAPPARFQPAMRSHPAGDARQLRRRAGQAVGGVRRPIVQIQPPKSIDGTRFLLRCRRSRSTCRNVRRMATTAGYPWSTPPATYPTVISSASAANGRCVAVESD